MDQNQNKIYGKMCIVALKKKDADKCIIALGCDLGYTVKLVNFSEQDIAEMLDVTPRTLHKLYQYGPDGERRVFPLELAE